ncbi:MAG: hypothetical protein V1882_04995 [Candidatus Omnitrophota bacterium]
MKKIYTKLESVHVLSDIGDLTDLKLDSCAVARKSGQVYVCPLDSLNEKRVEGYNNSGFSEPVFGFDDKKCEKFLIINGERKNGKFCDFCKDRLNGITGNCFNHSIKRGGCSFSPSKPLGRFNVSLGGWRYLKPSRVNKYSPFKKPWSAGYISLDTTLINRNKRVVAVRNDFWNQLKKKEGKYCSRCVLNGRCRMNSARIVERCMVTDEETQKGCMQGIQKMFGGVDGFLSRLAYSGKEITCRPKGGKRKSRWLITKPVGRNKFLIRKRLRPWKTAIISRKRVEKNAAPEALPLMDREKIAVLAWYFLEKYCAGDQEAYRGYRGRTIRTLSVTAIPSGIEVSYFPYGWGAPRPMEKRMESFNDVSSFDR